VTKNKKILTLEDFEHSEDFFGTEILEDLLADIGDKKFDVWFGDVHMYISP